MGEFKEVSEAGGDGSNYIGKFYRAVVQAVLLFGDETWVLLAAMINNIEGVHVVFLLQVTGMKARRLGDKTWTKEGLDRVLHAEGTKPLG